MSEADSRATIHANALLLGAAGVLLRGPAGSGKSALTLDLIDHAQARGDFARLIGDDRIELCGVDGRLIARPHPAIAGAVEIRGRGIVRVPFEPAGVIRLVVDLLSNSDPPPPRLPSESELAQTICGVTLPRLFARAASPSAPREILSYCHTLATK